jgi:hypothetical protein
MPFVGILVIGLILVMAFPELSTAAVKTDIAKAKAKSAEFGEPPREAWMMECVQEDRNNPLPCTEEDKKKWPGGQAATPTESEQPQQPTEKPGEDDTEDDLLDDMLEDSDGGAKKKGGDEDDELLDDMLGDDAKKKDEKKDEKKKKKGDGDTDDELLDDMLK